MKKIDRASLFAFPPEQTPILDKEFSQGFGYKYARKRIGISRTVLRLARRKAKQEYRESLHGTN